MYSEYRTNGEWPLAAVFESPGEAKGRVRTEIEQEVIQSRRAGAKTTISAVMRWVI
jgi:hypothetical protein